MRRAYGNRARSAGRPQRTWMSVSPQWSQTVGATTATALLGLESPTGGALTSDPPEDLTLLRIVGTFKCSLSGTSIWSLALIVQDATWTPGATLRVDQDKRILWARQFDTVSIGSLAGFTVADWTPPGQLTINATATSVVAVDPNILTVDIAPKVKVSAGQALYLVAYEESGAGTWVTTSVNMRVLYQRSGRR